MAELEKIVARKYPNPVISIYLSLDQKKVAPEPKRRLRDFHSLKTSALKDRKDYIATLTKRSRETLSHDLKEIEEFLAGYFPVGQKLAANTQVAIEHLNKNPLHLQDPQYQSHLKSNAEAAKQPGQGFCGVRENASTLEAMERKLEVH
jgi:outer membrane translocation and assembly module TamA